MTEEGLAAVQADMARRGLPVENLSLDELRNMVKMFGQMFRDNAPVSAAEAATVILDGVRAGKWRILIGEDAVALDRAVRAEPGERLRPGWHRPHLDHRASQGARQAPPDVALKEAMCRLECRYSARLTAIATL